MTRSLLYQGYTLSDDSARLQVGAIFDYLKTSYWAATRPQSVVEESLRHSLCIGTYAPEGAQVGLVRVVTDYSTFAYLCDVYVLESHRGKGLGKAALEFTLADPRLKSLRRINLVTADAHRLYARYGFAPLARPEGYMEKFNPA